MTVNFNNIFLFSQEASFFWSSINQLFSMKKQLLLVIAVAFALLNFSTVQAQTLNESLGSNAGVSITSGDYNTMIGDSAAFSLSSGSRNVMVGMAAGRRQTSGQQNTYVGYKAGYTNTTGQDNTAIGDLAGYHSTDTDGTFIGTMAGYNNTMGSDVVFIGEEAGLNNTTGDDNTFIGEDSGYNNTTASDNTFVGSTAGRTNTTGYRNAFFGSEAGYDNRDGHHNVAVGDSAMIDNSTGRWNTMVGAGSGAGSEYATGSTFIGAYAGYDNNRTNSTSAATRAWFNTYVGAGAGSGNREGSYNTALGYGADQKTSTAYYPGSGEPRAGTYSGANFDRGVYLGAFANSGGDDVVAIGYDAETFGHRAIAIGAFTDADDVDGIAIGYLGEVVGNNSIGIGRQVNTTYNNAIAIGREAVADSSSIAMGYQTSVQGQYSVAIGQSATVADQLKYANAIGSGASVTTSNSMVLGGTTVTDRVSVGIGTTAPNQNASLDLAETNKGLQINRLTNAQRTTLEGALVASDHGLMVYDTEDKTVYTWDGTQWMNTSSENTDAQAISLATNTLSITGNASTVDLSGYLDNTDAQAISLTTNTLSITGNASTVDLSGYLDNTDDQNLTSATLSGSTLTVAIEGGSSVNVDLSPILSALETENTNQQTQIDDLLTRVAAIEACACGGTLSAPGTEARPTGAVLYQNIPNPFSSTSSIKYFIPHSLDGKVTMSFSNTNGQIVSVVDINSKGDGELNINTADLSSGVYFYTLYVGAMKIDTKRMVVK